MEHNLCGKRIFFLGKLAGMARKAAEKFARGLGAKISVFLNKSVNLVVVGEADFPGANRKLLAEKFDYLTRIAFENGNLEILTETEFWKKWNLDAQADVSGPLYTPSMIAELLCVPPATVRLWIQRQLLKPVRRTGKLLYFDFQEILNAKRLIQIFSSGLSLDFVQKRLTQFRATFPDETRLIERLLLSPDGKDVFIRDDGSLFDRFGQRYFDFSENESSEKDFFADDDAPDSNDDFEKEDGSPDLPKNNDEFQPTDRRPFVSETTDFDDSSFKKFADSSDSESDSFALDSDSTTGFRSELFQSVDPFRTTLDDSDVPLQESDLPLRIKKIFHHFRDQEIVDLCEKAWELEKEGKSNEAIQLYRSALAFGGSDAGICFQLAELLRRSGDLRAAKERYYMVLELDEDYAEARARLGRVLIELSEFDEAVAALEGGLVERPNDFETRFELGLLLLRLKRFENAEDQFRYCRKIINDPQKSQEIDALLLECQNR